MTALRKAVAAMSKYAPFSKKQVKIRGMMTVGNMPLVTRIVIVEVMTATMKPISSELGP